MSRTDPTASSDLAPGPRDEVITAALASVLAELGDAATVTPIDAAEGPQRIGSHVVAALRAALAALAEHDASHDPAARLELGDDVVDDGLADRQAELANEILVRLNADPGEQVALPPRTLTAIRARTSTGGLAPAPRLPQTPLGQSDLLVNAVGQPNIGSELKAELATATRVDLLCAFVIMSGVAQLEEPLRALVDRGGEFRVITTTYMGATERAAVDRLVEIGGKVKVALDARTTKLHAKAWLLERAGGLTTAFIGSSNLSHTALFDGLEWNVRLSAADAPYVVDRVRTMFGAHWDSEHFDPYDPIERPEDQARLDRALQTNDKRRVGEAGAVFVALDVRPHPHQERMLERLDAERHRHDRHRNLLVAATGTGKTVMAALDYRRLCASIGEGRRPSLLFVAHRQEILQQALATYRQVLGDGGFGELHVGGHVADGRHVFASIQSLSARTLPQPDAFDVVVVDEFHHAEASTYRALLDQLQPRELLGLTATPERSDGISVQDSFFGGRIAAELRLWEAIDEGFLVPFQYFGVADGIDLSNLSWRRGDYDRKELERVYTADDARVKTVLRELRRVLGRPEDMRALGFCVSRNHAHFMAEAFTRFGLESEALTGDDHPDDRRRVLNRLARGELRCVFSVDVLGEGVDVPSVDTVLLLRPTQSPVVFAQQLGRGLRLAEGKSHLTVLDLIGQQHREFRIQDRYAVLLDRRRGSVLKQVEDDFPFLPAGCSIVLERHARDTVLAQLRAVAQASGVKQMASDLRQLPGDGDLRWFLEQTGRRIDDVYARDRASWTRVRREAGRDVGPEGPVASVEAKLLDAARRTRHIDDEERSVAYGAWLQSPSGPDVAALSERERRMLRMLLWTVWGKSIPGGLQETVTELWKYPAVVGELRQLFEATSEASAVRTWPSGLNGPVPMAVHGRYYTHEIIAALRPDSEAQIKPVVPQTGVHWERLANSDVFFVTLKKSEREYSPTTMYRDYAITRDRFHWESQSVQHQDLPTVQRYIDHVRQGSNVLLFVRPTKRDALGLTCPFTFLGPVRYLEHQGNRPVQFTWKLERPMPEELFEEARSVAVA